MRPSAIGAALLALAAGPAAAQEGPPSTATAIVAKFTAAGVASQIRPIATVSGALSRAYDSTETVAQVSETVAIAPGDPTPTLFVTGEGLSSHAAAHGRAGGGRESLGANSVAHLRLVLTAQSSTGSGDGPTVPALIIEVRELATSAYFDSQAATRSAAMGLMTVGSLSISGGLVGGETLRRSGQVAPNTILYNSPQVTITLNRQVESGVVTCDEEDCAEAPIGLGVGVIRMVGVDVALHGALVGSTRVSGQIRVDQATAQ